MSGSTPRVGIIGAGISGLACARALRRRGVLVEVFDKGRGPGGRMATRRVAPLGEGVTFDHGAQYFTARSPEMCAQVRGWLAEGVVAKWDGAIVSIDDDGRAKPSAGTTRFVGTPGMSAVCHHLSRELEVRVKCRVTEVLSDGGAWLLREAGGNPLGRFDVVVSTAPPEQTEQLLANAAPDIAARIATVSMDPCWALMVAFDHPLDLRFDGAFINGGPLSWVARTSAKPGRTANPERWVLHASAAWSNAHLEEEPDHVTAPLLGALFAATGLTPIEPAWTTAHRWRYAIAKNPLDDGALFDPHLGIGTCGDWANGNRVEGAWESGVRLANMITDAIV